MSTPLRIGLAGLGSVGGAFARLLHRRRDDLHARLGRSVEIAAYSARKPGDRGLPLGEATYVADPVALALRPEIDVFVELMGGAEGAAYEATKAALSRGACVVTANKAMLAAHGLELAAAAEAGGGTLAIEASVGGGIPIVKTLREGLAGNRIRRIFGILNGTCNYILSEMETKGLSFETCLKEAQRLGYAEADPTFDVGGHDTAHKLSILSSLAFGSKIDPDAIHVEGIDAITPPDIAAADELGYRIKLLGVAERASNGLEQRVHPTMISKTSPIGQTMGVLNAITIEGDAVGELTLVGLGAGGDATASAVAADLIDVASGLRAPTFGRPVARLEEAERIPVQRHEGGYYVRLAVADRPGAMAAIAKCMADRKISLEAIMQKRADKPKVGNVVPVVLLTHATTETSLRAAVASTVEDGVVTERPQVIRIERD